MAPASTRRPRDAVPWHRSGGQSTPDLGAVEWRCQTLGKMESFTMFYHPKTWKSQKSLGFEATKTQSKIDDLIKSIKVGFQARKIGGQTTLGISTKKPRFQTLKSGTSSNLHFDKKHKKQRL